MQVLFNGSNLNTIEEAPNAKHQQHQRKSQSSKKELLMGSTIRDLGNTIKEAMSKGCNPSEEDENESQHRLTQQSDFEDL